MTDLLERVLPNARHLDVQARVRGAPKLCLRNHLAKVNHRRVVRENEGHTSPSLTLPRFAFQLTLRDAPSKPLYEATPVAP